MTSAAVSTTTIGRSRPKGASPRGRAWIRFRRHRLAMFGLIAIAALVLAVVIGPWLIPFDQLHIEIRNRFKPPPFEGHLFGTDQLGRDLLVRLLMAGRISLTIGFMAMVVSTAIGTAVGVTAGYYGGLIGTVLMRIVDAVLCFPSVFLLLALAAFIRPNIGTITLIIAATSWMEVARVVQAQVRALRGRDFILAAEMMGASGAHVMARELLPNAAGPIIVAATLTVARAILMEAYVSFLGYGIQAPVASWGNMLNNAQELVTTAPALAVYPGLLIFITVIAVNFLGDGLQHAFDPRSER